MAKKPNPYDLNSFLSYPLSAKLKLLWPEQEVFFISSTSSYSNVLHYIFNHYFDCICKIIDMSSFSKNLDIF